MNFIKIQGYFVSHDDQESYMRTKRNFSEDGESFEYISMSSAKPDFYRLIEFIKSCQKGKMHEN